MKQTMVILNFYLTNGICFIPYIHEKQSGYQ